MKIKVYHGTNYDFNVFDKNHYGDGQLGKGFYFTTNRLEAFRYGKNVIEAEITLNNPFDIDADLSIISKQLGIPESKLDGLTVVECEDIIKEKGFDGIIAKNFWGEYNDYYVVFNPEQIKILDKETITETKNNDAFWKWFGNSKVVDNQGKPLVVYHGTNKSFNSFDKLKRGSVTGAKSSMDGFWFTTDKNLAGSYANLADYKSELSTLKRELKRLRNFPLANFKKEDEIEERIKELEKINTDNKHIISVYLKIENPKIIDAKGQKYNDFEENINQALYNMNGYDGLIVKNLIDVGEDENPSDFKPSTHYMVLSSNQIKSVDNNGTWSTTSDNIYESLEIIQDNINMFGEDETVYATKSDYDIINLLKNKPEFYRFIWDSKSGYYIISNGDTCIHADLSNIGYNQGILDSRFIKDGVCSLTFWKYDNEDSSRISDGCNFKYRYPFGYIYTRFDMSLEETSLYKTLGEPIEKVELSSSDMNESADNLNDAFWKWFGKSKLIEKGQPIIFYHRTNAVFDTFDKDFGSPLLADGFYFSSKPLSEWYGKNIMKVYLKMENPYIIEDMQNLDSVVKFVEDFNLLTEDIKTTLQNYSDDYRSDSNTAFDGKAALRRVVKWHFNDQTRYITERLQKKNYDGLIIKNSDGQGGIKYDEYIVFSPNQIKAIDNKGTWSIISDNIYETLNKELEKFL